MKAPIPPDLKVLVADDQLIMRDVTSEILRGFGIKNIWSVEHGGQALQFLQDHKDIDVVLTDWNMPHMDGVSLVRAMRQDADFKKILVMMVSATATVTEVREAIKAGIDDYVAKPFTADVLQTRLERLLTVRRG